MKNHTVYSQFCHAVETHRMMQDVRSVLCGYSGGVDSSVLLCLLSLYCREMGIALHAMHIHHGIRAEEATRDLDFCRAQCQALGIPFEAVYCDIPTLAKERGTGIEETARDERHRALEAYRQANGIDVIALAHNANDTLETVLFRLARGTALDGLCGIDPISGHIIRPLLFSTRDEIESFACTHGISHIHDSTNDELSYTRNYIRHEIVPRLCHVNQNAVQNASRSASCLRADRDYLQALASNTDIASDSLLSRRLVREYYQTVGAKPLSHHHVKSMITLLREGKTNQSLSLPGPITAIRTKRGLLFAAAPIKSETYCLPLTQMCTHLPCGGCVVISHHEKDIKAYTNIYKLAIQAKLDSAKIKGQLFVRNRNGKDTVRYGNMTRSVKKLLQSTSYPCDVRVALPLLCDQEGPIWLPSHPVCDRVSGEEDLYILFCYQNANEFIYDPSE